MDKMDKRNQPSRNMPGKGGQPSQTGQQAKSGQTMPQSGQMAPPPKGAPQSHTDKK
jgi:hypothetical protein